jgi:hypothetical protein
MDGTPHQQTHFPHPLILTYLIILVPMLTVMIRRKAPLGELLRAPFHALFVMLGLAVVIFIVILIFELKGIDHEGALGDVIFFALVIGAGFVAARLGRDDALGPRHLRGAVISAAKRLFTGNAKEPPGMTLAAVPVPLADETKHFKLIGTTGTGKSTAIQEMLAVALARGDRAIIADPDGGYLSRFYDPARDLILNPFDPDARKWDLFGEVANDYDVDQLARSLIPDNGEHERVWTGYARTVFSAVLQQAINTKKRSDAELIRLLIHAPLKELRMLLPGTSAAPFVEEGNEKMFGSVRAVAAAAVDALKYTIHHKAAPLSVRQWVREGAARQNGGRGGVLFFPYKAGEIAALASMISAWMRLGIFEAMDREEGDQRLWFVVDELDALGAIDGLKDALARLRKFGGRCILGFQSIAQVSGTYGKGVAETIVENCANTLILRCSASERGGTSEFASKLIGQREVIHTTHSRTSGGRDTTTTSNEQLRLESAVLASEIERLPDLTGYLKLASIPDWYQVTLTRSAEAQNRRPRRPVSTVTPPTDTPTPEIAAPARKPRPTSNQPKLKPKRSRPRGPSTAPKTDPGPILGNMASPASIPVPPSVDGMGAVQQPPGGAELRD